MALDPDTIPSSPTTARTIIDFWRARLYALATGFGDDPLDPDALTYVAPTRSARVPATFATILAGAAGDSFDSLPLDRADMVLHIEQRLKLHHALPAGREIEVVALPPRLFDRGADRGALIELCVQGRLTDESQPIFETSYVMLARGDGGFGGAPPPASDLPPLPDDPPARRLRQPTRRDQALLYALTGDENPIHLSPKVSAGVGFDAPILHGLCSYGLVGRALQADAGWERPLLRLDARFTAPMYPGETLLIDVWDQPDGVAFRATVDGRSAVVLDRGRAAFGAS